jgi:hypothetical protein
MQVVFLLELGIYLLDRSIREERIGRQGLGKWASHGPKGQEKLSPGFSLGSLKKNVFGPAGAGETASTSHECTMFLVRGKRDALLRTA